MMRMVQSPSFDRIATVCFVRSDNDRNRSGVVAAAAAVVLVETLFTVILPCCSIDPVVADTLQSLSGQ